jgi:multidrug resistance efflux pump
VAAPQKRERIRTPWKTRWQRFCYHGLPVIAFAVAVLFVGQMWLDHGSMPNAIGRVEAQRVNIAAAVDGKLMPLQNLPQGHWKQFDRVEKGQVVARLDDGPLSAELVALRGDAAALQAELAATELDARLSHLDRKHEHFREAAELAYQIERYRLQLIEQEAIVEETRLELQQLDAQIALLNAAYTSGVGISNNGSNHQADRQTLDALLQKRHAAVRQAAENLKSAQERQAQLPGIDGLDVQVLIAPLHEQIRAAEARVEEVRAQIDSLVIRAPISGMVSAVYSHPGQGIQTGEWILTIAASDADSIVGYVPAANRFRPIEGMPVGVRLRIPGSRMVTSVVRRVGSQWEPMPIELAADPQAPQLALPVRIEIPEGLVARPGELVDIRFFRREPTIEVAHRSVSSSERLYASAARRTAAPPDVAHVDEL